MTYDIHCNCTYDIVLMTLHCNISHMIIFFSVLNSQNPFNENKILTVNLEFDGLFQYHKQEHHIFGDFDFDSMCEQRRPNGNEGIIEFILNHPYNLGIRYVRKILNQRRL